jgi:hypothetical protein
MDSCHARSNITVPSRLKQGQLKSYGKVVSSLKLGRSHTGEHLCFHFCATQILEYLHIHIRYVVAVCI